MKQYIVYCHKNIKLNQIFYIGMEFKYLTKGEDFFIPNNKEWIEYMMGANLTLNEVECKILYLGADVNKKGIIYLNMIDECRKRGLQLINDNITSAPGGVRGARVPYKSIKYWSNKLNIGGECPKISLLAKELDIDQSRISKIARHYLNTNERLYTKSYTFEYIF